MEIIDSRNKREHNVDEEMQSRGYKAIARYQARSKAVKEAKELEDAGKDVQIHRVTRHPHSLIDFAYKLYLR